MARKARIAGAIVELMAGGEHHAWTLEDLHQGLARVGTATDFSSVFRAAEKLAAEGAVNKLVVDDGRARFELPGAHHDHLHCVRCDELIPVPCVIDRAASAAFEAESGSAVAEHSLILTGTCPACRTDNAR
jgi:Fur family transcriptional regulator, ferric uptake regulator